MTKLNCRAGDLAVVVKSQIGNEGKIVRCLRLLEAGDILKSEEGVNVIYSKGHVVGKAWITDVPISFSRTKSAGWVKVNLAIDEALRPIRDTDGEDEMLRIVGLPSEVAHG